MMLRPSTIELNPELAQAWQSVLSQTQHQIKGWTKPQQVTFVEQLVLSALINAEKCLVLTADLAQAEELKNCLAKAQVVDLCAMHDATALNEALIQQTIEQNLAKKKWPKIIVSTQFGQNFDKLERCRLRLNKLYQAVRKPVFGNLNWPELVGVYWRNQEQSGKERVPISLPQMGFEFNLEEFKSLLKVVKEAQPLYHAVQRLDHPLMQLHPQVFLKKEEQAAQRFCGDKLQAYQLRFETLVQKYNLRIEEYGRLLRQYFEQHAQAFLTETDQLLDQIDDKVSAYGAPFLDAKLGKIKWYGPLSSQGKSAISAYKQLIQDYEALKSKFERVRWFSFVWPSGEKTRSIAPLKAALESFENTLKNGHIELGKFILEEQLRLNTKSALPELAIKTQIAALEEEMDDLLTDFNGTDLLSSNLENKMLTLSKRKQYLAQVQQQLAHLQQNMPDFAPFYAWQRFWLQLSEPQQNLLKTLAENQINEWPIAFQTWYCYQVLLKSKSIDAPLNPPPLQEYYQLWTQFKTQLPEQIKQLWQQRQQVLQQQFKGNKKSPEKTRGEELTKSSLEAYTELFPALILTSIAPGKWPQTSTTLFDWVLILETGKVPETDLERYAQLGKRVVVIDSAEAPKDHTAAGMPEEITLMDPDAATEAFWTSFQLAIRPYFGKERVKQATNVEGLLIPMSLQPIQSSETGVAFLGDGFLSQKNATDFAWEYQQQVQLKQDQGEIVPVWSTACWQNLVEECRKIAAQIISLEKHKNK